MLHLSSLSWHEFGRNALSSSGQLIIFRCVEYGQSRNDQDTEAKSVVAVGDDPTPWRICSTLVRISSATHLVSCPLTTNTGRWAWRMALLAISSSNPRNRVQLLEVLIETASLNRRHVENIVITHQETG